MIGEFGFEQEHREQRRWLILRVLDAGKPIGASEYIMATCLEGLNLTCNREELRRDLRFLQEIKLIDLDEQELDYGWYGRLRAEGAHVVDYKTPAPEGIARPARHASR
jgi:hypothetical protein